MKPIRVLIVDDHPMVRRGLRSLLSAYEEIKVVGEAEDGPSALKAGLDLSPDIILLDIVMPRLDGFGVIESLRNQPATQNLPIIVISAKELSKEESERLKASVTTVMKKQGFQGEQLVNEITKVLKM